MAEIIYDSVQTIEDIDAVIVLMEKAVSEQSFKARADSKRMRELVTRLYHRDPMLKHIIARIEGRVAAYFIWSIQEDLLTGDVLHRELSLYVHPDYRGLTGGKIFAYFLDVVSKGAQKIVCTAPDAQVATLEKKGFVKYGNAMLLDKGV